MSSLTSAVRELRGLNDHPGDLSKISIKTHYVEMSCIQFICWINLNLNICIFFTLRPSSIVSLLFCIRFFNMYKIFGIIYYFRLT